MMLLVLGVTVFLPAYVRTGGYVQYEKKIHCALEKYDCRYVRVRFRTLTEGCIKHLGDLLVLALLPIFTNIQ